LVGGVTELLQAEARSSILSRARDPIPESSPEEESVGSIALEVELGAKFIHIPSSITLQ
jgi:hypothetical protein